MLTFLAMLRIDLYYCISSPKNLFGFALISQFIINPYSAMKYSLHDIRPFFSCLAEAVIAFKLSGTLMKWSIFSFPALGVLFSADMTVFKAALISGDAEKVIYQAENRYFKKYFSCRGNVRKVMNK